MSLLIRITDLLISLTSTRYLGLFLIIILVSGIRLFFKKILWSVPANIGYYGKNIGMKAAYG